MRGRNRPKGPNPLTRSYESNGPDIKVRGTAQHIADKYAQLARDALASGDPIAAENYFQHGEHYFRIITSAQEPNRAPAAQGYARNAFDDEDEGDAEGGFEPGRQGYGEEYADPGHQPQPYERHDYDARQNRNDRGDRQDYRQDQRRDRFPNRNDRPQRFDRGDNGRGDARPEYGARQDGRQDNFRQENGRQENARQENVRHENVRHENTRQDNHRQDNRHDGRQEPRYEPGRQGGHRQDFNRQDQFRERGEGRHENGRDPYRGEQGRSDAFPRRDRRQDEATADEASGLPAFLMTATRNPLPQEPEAGGPRAPTEPPSEAGGFLPQAEADAGPAPKPKRRRARYKGSEAGGDEGGGSVAADTPSSVE